MAKTTPATLALDKAGVKNPIVCANVNKLAFRMAGGIEAYREATKEYPARVIAMSVLALLPVLIFFLVFQRYIFEGVSTQGLKG